MIIDNRHDILPIINDIKPFIDAIMVASFWCDSKKINEKLQGYNNDDMATVGSEETRYGESVSYEWNAYIKFVDIKINKLIEKLDPKGSYKWISMYLDLDPYRFNTLHDICCLYKPSRFKQLVNNGYYRNEYPIFYI